MVFGGDSSPGSSHIPQIIQKSKSYLGALLTPNPHRKPRVLVATIHDQGGCPCVQCLVTTPQISALGTAEDRTLHQTKLHMESAGRQQRVKDA